MFLSQHKYDIEILKRASMAICNSSRTPVETESKLSDDGELVSNLMLQLLSSSTTSLVAYSDADWAGCPTTWRSTLGYFVFLGNNLISWSYKRQPMLSRFGAEAEYCGVANAVVKACWLRNLLHLVADGQMKSLDAPLFLQTWFADEEVKPLKKQTKPKCFPSALLQEFRTSAERLVSLDLYSL
ncbi:ribonuclease H-like domain-containing protein [Tanacetum coccineum]